MPTPDELAWLKEAKAEAEANLARLNTTSCEYAVEAHGATICGSCWWCRGE